MKKIILLITVLSLSTFVSAGFFSDDKGKGKIENSGVTIQGYSKAEFHGLKAGMTKSEVREYLQLDKYLSFLQTKFVSRYNNTTVEDLYSMDIKRFFLRKIKLKDFSSRKKFSHFLMSFTEDGILWRIQIAFNVPKDILKYLALRGAVKNNFPDANIEEKDDYIYVIMADKEISESAISKLKIKFEKEM